MKTLISNIKLSLLGVACATGLAFASSSHNNYAPHIDKATSDNIHPKVEWQDIHKQLWTPSSGVELSTQNSCNKCHNVEKIATHNTHKEIKNLYNSQGEMRCLVCHINPDMATVRKVDSSSVRIEFKPDTLELHQKLSKPSVQNCTACHQDLKKGFQAQKISASPLNIAGKDSIHRAFDVHAAAGLSCVDCHQSSNHPSLATESNSKSPSHLKKDPRKASIREFLKAPSHHLNMAGLNKKANSCTQCHNEDQHAKWLPQHKTHMKKLACTACHIPQIIEIGANAKIDTLKPSLLIEKNGQLKPFKLSKDGKDTLIELTHTVSPGAYARKDCNDCHTPQESENFGKIESLDLETQDDSLGVVNSSSNNSKLYVFGRDNVTLVDYLGVLSLLGVIVGVLFHGGLRIILSFRKTSTPPKQVHKVYMYGVYERFWHWTQAMMIMILLYTGLSIHLPNTLLLLNFDWAVRIHNAIGIMLLINAAVSLIYHLSSGEIKQYLPEPKDFISNAIKQQMYYLKGIFQDAPHPFEKDLDHKLNPLQKLGYIFLLNILLPIQIITGVGLFWYEAWGLSEWLTKAQIAGGHALASWFMASFLVMHVYLTTTGDKPLSLIKAMITGVEKSEHGGGK